MSQLPASLQHKFEDVLDIWVQVQFCLMLLMRPTLLIRLLLKFLRRPIILAQQTLPVSYLNNSQVLRRADILRPWHDVTQAKERQNVPNHDLLTVKTVLSNVGTSFQIFHWTRRTNVRARTYDLQSVLQVPCLCCHPL